MAVAWLVGAGDRPGSGLGVIVGRDRVLVVEEVVAQVLVIVVVNHAHVRKGPRLAAIGGFVHPHLPARTDVGRG